MICLIDIHSHFLPNIDDGAKSEKESFEMLQDSVTQGVTKIVATPHCVIHQKNDIFRFIENRRKSFEKIKGKGKTPKILLGAEVYFDNDLSEYENIDKLCIGNTPYILIEIPMKKHDYAKLSEWLYSLTLIGLKPVIAHIDRYPDFAELISNFDTVKVIYQINASRFFTFTGKRRVKKILDMVDFAVVSSDMHNMTIRKCNMKAAFEKAKKMLPDKAEDLFANNAEIVIK